MNAPARLRLDPEEYLHWEAAQERKHELVGGEVRAMAIGARYRCALYTAPGSGAGQYGCH